MTASSITCTSRGISRSAGFAQVQRPKSTGELRRTIQRRNIWIRLLAEDLPFGTMADFGKRAERAVARSGVGVADGKLVVTGLG